MPDQLFDPGPGGPEPGTLSATRRLTLRNQRELDAGRHPATGEPLNDHGTCGQCAHLCRGHHHDRYYLKCTEHRLGLSHSTASDVRASWPACVRWVAKSTLEVED